MPTHTVSPVQAARGRKANATKVHGADSPQVRDASRELAAAKIAQYVERVVADAPPLTDEQIARIAAILVGGAR